MCHAAHGNPFYARERGEIDSHFGEKIEALPPTDGTKRAHDTESAASRALLTTAPTTLTGAVALLRYVEGLSRAGDDVLATSCGDGEGYDALVSSLIQVLAPLVQK